MPRENPPDPRELVEIARSHLGTPYIRGGTGQGGFDCSGFVNKVYAQVGYDLPRVSREQFKVGLKVPRLSLQAGDLLFFVSSPGGERIAHVAMYVEDDELIHAVVGKGEVSYDRLTSRYYTQRFAGARRIIALPPGQYSNRRGQARRGTLFESPVQIGRHVGAPSEVREGDEIGHLISELTEDEDDSRLWQPSPHFGRGAVTRVGPRMRHEDATTVGLRLGAGRMADLGSLLAVPELRYFGHSNALRIAVAAPVQIPVGGELSVGDALEDQWSQAEDYTKVIQRISYGHKESNLYIDLSRTASATLGHGQLVRYYTPNISSRFMPHYVVDPDALSLTFDGSLDFGGLEMFVDDLVRPVVVGARARVQPLVLVEAGSPFWRSLSLATTYVADVRAPYARGTGGKLQRRVVHGVGMDIEAKPYSSENLELTAYADTSGIVHEAGGGVGGAIGVLLKSTFGDRLHVLRARFEARLSGPTFIPSYFDTTYRLNRVHPPVDQTGDAITKLALLEDLEGTPGRWGAFGELIYHYARRVSVGVAYEDGGPIGSLPPSERYTGRSLMVFTHIRNLYLPGSSRRVDLYFAYHLRSFENLWPLFGMKRPNEYLFVAASVQIWRYVAVGGGIRKAMSLQSGEAALDAVVDLSFRYEI
ncbi:C40 family peptidase [Myxococcota bacterium]